MTNSYHIDPNEYTYYSGFFNLSLNKDELDLKDNMKLSEKAIKYGLNQLDFLFDDDKWYKEYGINIVLGEAEEESRLYLNVTLKNKYIKKKEYVYTVLNKFWSFYTKEKVLTKDKIIFITNRKFEDFDENADEGFLYMIWNVLDICEPTLIPIICYSNVPVNRIEDKPDKDIFKKILIENNAIDGYPKKYNIKFNKFFKLSDSDYVGWIGELSCIDMKDEQLRPFSIIKIP